MNGLVQRALREDLGKVAAPTTLWDRLKDFMQPSSARAKKDVQEHLKSDDPKKWDRFIENATKSPDFIKQLERNKKVDKKDVLHAVYMGALQTAPVAGQVESSSSSGTQYQIKELPNGKHGCTCNDWRFKGSVNPGYECKHIKAFKAGLTKVAGFSEMTSAFFDELQKIRDQKKREVYQGTHEDYASSARPYSDLLTPGETTYYNPRPANPMEDPEVILGGSFAR